MSDDALRQTIGSLAAPLVEAAGVEVVDIEVRGHRGSRIVRLIADADDGLDVDTIAQLSRDLGRRLDEDDVVEGRYTLEVTSPGVDRPLRSARQLRRNVGRDVRIVRTREAIDRGEKGEVAGRLAQVADGAVTVTATHEELVVPLADIDYAKVVLPW